MEDREGLGIFESGSTQVRNAALGDKRLVRRLGQIVDAVTRRPEASFPEAMGSQAALEGFYRFLRNEQVSPEAILLPHLQATVERIKARADTTLVIHDTTEFAIPGRVWRDGLGWIEGTKRKGKKKQGFFGHFSLALSSTDSEPLGIMGYQSVNRLHEPVGSERTYAQTQAKDKETKRWQQAFDEVEDRIGETGRVLHVTDREGDLYALLAHSVQRGQRFVIRVKHNRVVVEDDKSISKRGGPKLFPTIEAAVMKCEREVALSARRKRFTRADMGSHTDRDARKATLHFSASKVSLRRSQSLRADFARSICLNVVRVWEPEPPEGEEPVEWKLFTTESIDTPEDILKIVDIYRARWRIEEYFKALKTGCRYESRQMESFETLQNALAILAPVALRLLQMRHLSRSNPDAPASQLFTTTQIEVLRYNHAKRLPDHLTIAQATAVLAELAGHHKSNGPPGWQILWRGYRDLLLQERAWIGGKLCDR